MATLSLSNLGKTYPGGVQAVAGVNLEVADGEFIVVVGPSGCGKSTLLRMIAGLEAITEGELKIGERVVNRVEPADRDIAMVFQNYALYPHMSVYDNMAYGLRNRREKKAEIERKVREAGELLGLEDLLERKPNQLSGGQRQRVAMGRAIVREPQVFLFDEPLSNLDAKLRVQMRLEIKHLQKRLGVTSVYVTHDQIEAMTLADRLVAINGGRVEQVGTPMELYQRPASLFVAGFIGTPPMNVVPGRIEGGIARIGGTPVAETKVADGTPVTIGFRPEHMTPVKPRTSPLAGRIELVEQLGAEALLHLSMAELPKGQGVTMRLPGANLAQEGNVVTFTVDPAKVLLFDEAGKLIATE